MVKPGTVRTVFRRIVLGAFVVTVVLIVLLLSQAMISATGRSGDPHGYGMIFGVALAVCLAPFGLRFLPMASGVF